MQEGWDPAEQRAINRFVRTARHVWDGDYRVKLAAELDRLLPNAVSAVYQLDDEGRPGAVGHTHGANPRGTWEGIRNVELLPTVRKFALDGSDPNANRAVTDRDLYSNEEENEHFRRVFTRPNGLDHQLRVVLYRNNRFLGHVSALRAIGEEPFEERAAAKLQAVVPALHDGLVALELLGDEPLGDCDLARTLDAFAQPAYLTTAEGVAVHANTAARSAPADPPEWIAACVRGERGAARLARVVCLGPAPDAFRLVVPRHPELAAPRGRQWDLPPRLADVAELIAQGLTDREIAASLEVSYHSVRTYVARLFKRLDVASRVEVAQMAAAQRREPPD